MNGAQLIAEERQRQVNVEGWSAEHDDKHYDNEMAWAAICYVKRANIGPSYHPQTRPPLSAWPWDDECWKPSEDRVRNLVKAGALIAAEIDRLQRVVKGPANIELEKLS